ncbi:FeoB-associated Cys-rich membrane protein [Candidatus Electrothrix sp.]|uniref:FeoB-associated Cys-rich membrane protein n=1 Tax=Candidatus Electrothrix sp. TaxID=2170559 RepID=UPI004055FC91
MQDFIVMLVVLIACIFVGRSLFRFYRSGKCSCSSGCSGCGEDTKTGCFPQAKQQDEQGEKK